MHWYFSTSTKLPRDSASATNNHLPHKCSGNPQIGGLKWRDTTRHRRTSKIQFKAWILVVFTAKRKLHQALRFSWNIRLMEEIRLNSWYGENPPIIYIRFYTSPLGFRQISSINVVTKVKLDPSILPSISLFCSGRLLLAVFIIATQVFIIAIKTTTLLQDCIDYWALIPGHRGFWWAIEGDTVSWLAPQMWPGFLDWKTSPHIESLGRFHQNKQISGKKCGSFWKKQQLLIFFAASAWISF